VKRFEFPLERVRQWRDEQASIEESKLEQLFTALRAVDARRSSLDREQAVNQQAVLTASSVPAVELAALDKFLEHGKRQRQILAGQRAECERLLEAQRQRVMEARRNFQLLDKLKQRRRTAWQADFDRELEAQAAESYLARWTSLSSG